jgi:hypothetical protein
MTSLTLFLTHIFIKTREYPIPTGCIATALQLTITNWHCPGPHCHGGDSCPLTCILTILWIILTASGLRTQEPCWHSFANIALGMAQTGTVAGVTSNRCNWQAWRCSRSQGLQGPHRVGYHRTIVACFGFFSGSPRLEATSLGQCDVGDVEKEAVCTGDRPRITNII